MSQPNQSGDLIDFQGAAARKTLNRLVGKMAEYLEAADYGEELDLAKTLYYYQHGEETGAVYEQNRKTLETYAPLENFYNWFFLDCWLEEGVHPVDRFRKETQNRLSPQEKKLVKLLRDSFVSLYKVTEAIPGQGFSLEDIFTQEQSFIRENSDLEGISQGLVIVARLIENEGRSYLVDTGVTFLPLDVPCLLKHFENALKLFSQKQQREASTARFLKEAGILFFNGYYLEQWREADDGESVSLPKEEKFPYALFEVLDFDAARQSLKSIREISVTQESLGIVEAQWLNGKEKGGFITLIPAVLVMECQTEEILEQGRKLLLSHLGKFIKYNRSANAT